MSNDKRVNPGVPEGGQFAQKVRPDYTAVLGTPLIWPGDEFSTLLSGETVSFSHANGDFDANETVFESVDVYRSESDAEPPDTLWAEAYTTVDFNHLSGVDDEYLTSHAWEIDGWIRQNYADVGIDGFAPDTEWEDTVLTSDVDFGDDQFPATRKASSTQQDPGPVSPPSTSLPDRPSGPG